MTVSGSPRFFLLYRVLFTIHGVPWDVRRRMWDVFFSTLRPTSNIPRPTVPSSFVSALRTNFLLPPSNFLLSRQSILTIICISRTHLCILVSIYVEHKVFPKRIYPYGDNSRCGCYKFSRAHSYPFNCLGQGNRAAKNMYMNLGMIRDAKTIYYNVD